MRLHRLTSRFIPALAIMLSLTAACSNSDPGFGDGNARFSVYFNEPGRDPETMVNKFIDLELVKIIDEAEESVLLSVYNFNKQSIIDAILRARERNIEVKVVGDIDEFYTHGYQQMQRFNIDMSLGNSSGIQHNKFAVVDRRLVFTGTGNLSDTDMDRNNNNWYIIESPEIANHYRNEFMQMYSGLFAARKRPRAVNRSFLVNDHEVEVYFSPYDGQDAMDKLIEMVNSAQHNVYYMIFAHTHDELAGAMIHASRQRNIPVYGIHDNTFVVGVSEEAPRIYSASFNNDGSQHPFGPFARWDGNENTKIRGNPAHGGKMHCKTLIIDAGTPHAKIATGSFNWSNNAINNNDENMIVIHNAKIANTIYEQFKQAWGISNDLALRVGRRGHIGTDSDIVISEINWAGSSTLNSLRQNDVYIEIYNKGTAPVDLSHWSIQWGPDEWRNIYPIPDRHNWYYENKQTCSGFPGYQNFSETVDNVICPGMYRVFYADSASAYAPPSEDEVIVYNEDGAALYTRVAGLQQFRISGVKNFRLSNAEFKVRLFDKAMTLIDEAGDGFNAPAGSMDVNARISRSMERRSHTDGNIMAGALRAAWFTATQKYSCSHWSELFDTCSNAEAGQTFASAGTGFNTPAQPRLRSIHLTSPTTLTLNFSSNMSFCNSPAHISLDKTSGAGNVPGSYTLAQTSPGIVTVTATTGNFSDSATLFSVRANSDCRDYLFTSATDDILYFNGHNTARATTLLNRVNIDTNWIEIRAQTSGSVRGLRLFYYDHSGMNLIHEFGELSVNSGEIMVVSTRRSEANLLKNEDLYNANGCDTGFSNPTCAIAARNGSPFHINSIAPTLTTTDAVVILTYCGTNEENSTGCALSNYGVQDVLYYTNRDGGWTGGFAQGALREVHRNLSEFWPLSQFPVAGLNDRALQLEGICVAADSILAENTAYNCSSSCRGVARVDDLRRGKDSWRCETSMTRPGY